MDTLRQDLRFAVRTLLRRPTLTFLAVLTLALGIGANTAIFSVVNSVLLAPLPFHDPDRLVVVWASSPELAKAVGLPDTLPVASGDFYDWKAQSTKLADLSLVGSNRHALTGRGEPEMLGTVNVTGDLFRLLGTKPLLGRTLQPADDETGEATVTVLSHRLWQRRFGGDRSIVGQTITLNGKPVTVVGVMPPGFAFPRGAEMPAGFGFAAEPELWVPMALKPDERQSRDNHNAVAFGRLKPGASREAANAEIVAICARITKQAPQSVAVWSARVEPLTQVLTGSVRPALFVLSGAVALVLLIACVNVANLLLAQAAARQKEVAVRTALGASRRRMLRQLLTESLLLSLVGGAGGLLLASWGLRALAALIPAGVRVSGGLALDGRVLAFTLILTLAAGALAGLMPALQMTRSDLASTLRDGTRAGAVTSRGRRTLRALVVVETAVAVLLAVGAGLLVRSFGRLTAVDPGFHPGGVLTLRVPLAETKYDETHAAAFYAAALERVRALPGVAAAGAVSNLPMSGNENISGFIVEGMARPALDGKSGGMPLGDRREATPGYFEAMGIRLQSGRLFRDGDGDGNGNGSPRVAVVDETLARTYWPGADPIGKRIHRGDFGDKDPKWITVVGVVGNVRNSGLHVEPRPQLYLPHVQSRQMSIAVRTQGDPERLIKPVSEAIHAIDPDQPVSEIMTMDQMIDRSLAGRRFNLVLLGLFAGLAVVLAAVGIYGVMSYQVAQRTREMGLRMALGAQRGAVLALVVREAGLLSLTGLGAGLVLSLLATRVMASLLFGVGATDPLTLAVVSACLALVSLAAAYVPGERATRVDPMVALRAD
jgi:putative ABC transport system permease protein